MYHSRTFRKVSRPKLLPFERDAHPLRNAFVFSLFSVYWSLRRTSISVTPRQCAEKILYMKKNYPLSSSKTRLDLHWNWNLVLHRNLFQGIFTIDQNSNSNRQERKGRIELSQVFKNVSQMGSWIWARLQVWFWPRSKDVLTIQLFMMWVLRFWFYFFSHTSFI